MKDTSGDHQQPYSENQIDGDDTAELQKSPKIDDQDDEDEEEYSEVAADDNEDLDEEDATKKKPISVTEPNDAISVERQVKSN